VPVADTISCSTPASGHTDTRAPDAASWAATPTTAVDGGAGHRDGRHTGGDPRLPPVMAADAVFDSGSWLPT
jgi:hypothetical protein